MELWVWGDASTLFGLCGGNFQYPTRLQVVDEGGANVLEDVREVVPDGSGLLLLTTDGSVWVPVIPKRPPDGLCPAPTTTPTVVVKRGTGPDGVGYMSDVVALSNRNPAVIAARKDGAVWAWGENDTGQFGNGKFSVPGIRTSNPVQVLGPGGVGKLTDVTRVATGQSFVLAVKKDGTVWAWGSSSPIGDLGNGTTIGSFTPVQVVGPEGQGVLDGIVDVACEGRNSLALRKDGTVWAWGYNGVSFHLTPTRVGPTEGPGTLDGVVAISASPWHELALKADGTVWAWGVNVNGQLGDGTTINRKAPVQVQAGLDMGPLTDVVAISAGLDFSVALKSDGTVWTWGSGTNGQMGDGPPWNEPRRRTFPAPLPRPEGTDLLRGVKAIAARGWHGIALRPVDDTNTMAATNPTFRKSDSEFRLGFRVLADQIPDVVGVPLEDEHYGVNGDSLQQTTEGLMVWRKADNWTAFTNGSRTWINGPHGVMERGNDDRFEWEAG